MAENETEKKTAPQAADSTQKKDPDKPERPGPANSEDAKAPASAPKTGPSQLLAVALLCGMVVGSASAAVVVASLLVHAAPTPAVAPAENADKAANDKAEKPCEFTIENPLIVNVYQTQERRYLSVKPVLVLAGNSVLEKVKTNQAELQHILIGILKGKTLDQLDDPDAANVLGREIQETANLKLNLEHGITRVYFTQFVVQ